MFAVDIVVGLQGITRTLEIFNKLSQSSLPFFDSRSQQIISIHFPSQLLMLRRLLWDSVQGKQKVFISTCDCLDLKFN